MQKKRVNESLKSIFKVTVTNQQTHLSHGTIPCLMKCGTSVVLLINLILLLLNHFQPLSKWIRTRGWTTDCTRVLSKLWTLTPGYFGGNLLMNKCSYLTKYLTLVQVTRHSTVSSSNYQSLLTPSTSHLINPSSLTKTRGKESDIGIVSVTLTRFNQCSIFETICETTFW